MVSIRKTLEEKQVVRSLELRIIVLGLQKRLLFVGGDLQVEIRRHKKKCKNFVSEIHLFIVKRGRVFHIEILEDRFIFFINTCFS